MQFQADVLGAPVDRPVERESTALGAAMLAMLSADLIDEEELSRLRRSERVFAPDPSVRDAREAAYREYRNAVRRALLR